MRSSVIVLIRLLGFMRRPASTIAEGCPFLLYPSVRHSSIFSTIRRARDSDSFGVGITSAPRCCFDYSHSHHNNSVAAASAINPSSCSRSATSHPHTASCSFSVSTLAIHSQKSSYPTEGTLSSSSNTLSSGQTGGVQLILTLPLAHPLKKLSPIKIRLRRNSKLFL